MFGIGFGEILIVVLIAIVFIRPKDLPKFLRSAGKFYGQVKRMYKEVIETKDKIIKEIDEAATFEEAPKTAPKPAAKEPPKAQPAASPVKPDEPNAPEPKAPEPKEEPPKEETKEKPPLPEM